MVFRKNNSFSKTDRFWRVCYKFNSGRAMCVSENNNKNLNSFPFRNLRAHTHAHMTCAGCVLFVYTHIRVHSYTNAVESNAKCWKVYFYYNNIVRSKCCLFFFQRRLVIDFHIHVYAHTRAGANTHTHIYLYIRVTRRPV